MTQPREFPDFPDPGGAIKRPPGEKPDQVYVEPIPELHLWQYIVEVTDYFKLVDDLGAEATAKLLERYSGGRIKREFLMDFHDRAYFNKLLKELLGFVGSQAFKLISVGHPGDSADRYLVPGVESPGDIARREAERRYIDLGLKLSPQRDAELQALVSGAISAGLARVTPVEYLEELFRGGRLEPSRSLRAIVNGSAILNDSVRLVGAANAAEPPHLLVWLAMQLAKGVVRDLVTERADP